MAQVFEESSKGIRLFSDFHIGGPSYTCYRFEIRDKEGHLPYLERLIEEALVQGRDVVLLGDVFDFYCSMLPGGPSASRQEAWGRIARKYKGFVDYLANNLERKAQRGKIYYLRGNHEGVSHTFAQTPFSDVLLDELDLNIAGLGLVHFEHGDGLKPGEETAEFFHAPEWLGSLLDKSLKLINYSPYRDLTSTISRARSVFKTNNYAACVMGHTHVPSVFKFKEGGLFINSGTSAFGSYYHYGEFLYEKNFQTPLVDGIDEADLQKRSLMVLDAKTLKPIFESDLRERLNSYSAPFLTYTDLDGALSQITVLIRPKNFLRPG